MEEEPTSKQEPIAADDPPSDPAHCQETQPPIGYSTQVTSKVNTGLSVPQDLEKDRAKPVLFQPPSRIPIQVCLQVLT